MAAEKFPDFYARLREFQVRTWANKQMLPTEAAALEAVVMETWLADEIKCESPHAEDGNRVCSVDVTHLANGCAFGDNRVCTNLVTVKKAFMASGGICADCLGRAADCWSYRPI